MQKGKIVLAYSGGLDTSICIPLLREHYGFDEIITVAVDVGQPEEETARATEKGRKFADKHYTIDVKEKFVTDYIFPSIKANGSYEGYPMGTSLARPLIAEELVKIAQQEGASKVAHGCTGKGNDQHRNDYIKRSDGNDNIKPQQENKKKRKKEKR